MFDASFQIVREQLQPGDGLVVTVGGPISPETADRIKAGFAAWAKESGWKVVPAVIVLDCGMKLAIVSAESLPA